MPEKIGTKLAELFVPQEDHLGGLREIFEERFPIIEQVKELLSSLFSPVDEEAPDWTFTFNDYHGYSGTVSVLNLSWYEPYRAMVKTMLAAFIWGATFLKIIKMIPSILGGIGR